MIGFARHRLLAVVLVAACGVVLVNGQRLPEPYLVEAPEYTMPPLKLGPREYLMLGDNRNNSRDSHYWGALSGSRIVGRAEAIYWPPRRACWLGEPRGPIHAGL